MSSLLPAVETCIRALEKVRNLESSKEHRYLMRCAMDALRSAVAGGAAAPPQPAPNKQSERSSPPAVVPHSSAAEAGSGESALVLALSEAPPPPPPPNAEPPSPSISTAPVPETQTGGANALDRAVNFAVTVVKQHCIFSATNNRTNYRLLDAVFELCHTFLNSGVVPIDAVWVAPSLHVPAHVTASVFAKMMNMVRAPADAAATESAAGGSGGSSFSSSSVAATAMTEAKPFELLTAATLALASIIPLTEPVVVTACAALFAAVTPARIRQVTVQEHHGTHSARSAARPPLLGLRGSLLHDCVYYFISLSSRAQQFPTIANYCRSGLSSVVTALSKELERLGPWREVAALHSGAQLSSPGLAVAAVPSPTSSPAAHGASFSLLARQPAHDGAALTAIEVDVVVVMRLCVNILHDGVAGQEVSPMSAAAAAKRGGEPFNPSEVAAGRAKLAPEVLQAKTAYASTVFVAVASSGGAPLTSPPPPPPLKNADGKSIALTTLLQFIVNGGPGFRKSPAVKWFIKDLLFPRVLQTALSNEIDIFRVSLNILLLLYFAFQAEMVVECGAFFQHVLFQVLSSANTSSLQKTLVLEALKSIAAEPKNLLNLFLNYDCDVKSTNVYGTLIATLHELTNGGSATGGKDTLRGSAQGSRKRQKPPSTFRDGGASSTAVIVGSQSLPAQSQQPQQQHQLQLMPGQPSGGSLQASSGVTSTSSGGGLGSPSNPNAERSLQQLSLEVLLRIAESNLQWIERFEVSRGAAGGSKALAGGNTRASTTCTNDAEGSGALGGDAPPSHSFTTSCLPAVPTSEATAAVSGCSEAKTGSPLAPQQQQLDATPSNDLGHLVRAKRRKDQLEQFLLLVNKEQNLDKAIAFLETSELLMDETTATATRTNAASDATGGPSVGNRRSSSPRGLDMGTRGTEDGDEDDDDGDNEVEDDPLARTEKALDPLRRSVATRIAAFLFSLDGMLDRLVLGDFFSKSFRKDFLLAIFKHWIEKHQFRGLSLDVALRHFLGGFKLLGEAQVVDRTMELFAAHYCHQNPTAFSSANTAFVLAFSCCMLNTDAHSAHVKEKMSKEAFVRNNRGIDDGKDVDLEVLSGIYDRITLSEIKLRPLKPGVKTMRDMHPVTSDAQRSTSAALAVLSSIPLLRHLTPIAETIGDTVMIPVDAAGNVLFNTAQRRRAERYQTEFHAVLKEALAVLRDRRLDAAPTSFVEATSLEHAIPMWDLTVDVLVEAVEGALDEVCGEEATAALRDGSDTPEKAPVSPGMGGSGVSTGHSPATASALPTFASDTNQQTSSLRSREEEEAIFDGVMKTLKVCASFGYVAQAERLVRRMFHLTMLPRAVIVRRAAVKADRFEVLVRQRPPWCSLRCAVCLVEVFATVGSAFTATMWEMAYQLVSYLDALLSVTSSTNRASKQRPPSEPALSAARRPWWQWFGGAANPPAADPPHASPSVVPAVPPEGSPSANGSAPGSVHLATSDVELCVLITNDLNALCAIDMWVERLYDATSYSSQSLLQMVNGLCTVATKELDVGRVFSVSRLAEFCTVCTSVATRMQWRDLWANAEPVFIAGGCKDAGVALCVLDGLKGIAFHYLLKEELSLYRFQKDLLRPFERILMRNANVQVRSAVQTSVSEMIEHRASQLASGWSVLLSLMSHGALLPEIVHASWSCCELLVGRHLSNLADCFGDLIFCLTSFASNTVDEHVALLGASYVVACGSWLQAGLRPLPVNRVVRLSSGLWQRHAPPGGSSESTVAVENDETILLEASAMLLDVPILDDAEACLACTVLNVEHDASDSLRVVAENRGAMGDAVDLSHLPLRDADWDAVASAECATIRWRALRSVTRLRTEQAEAQERLTSSGDSAPRSVAHAHAGVGGRSPKTAVSTAGATPQLEGVGGKSSSDTDGLPLLPETLKRFDDTVAPTATTSSSSIAATAAGGAPRVTLAPHPLSAERRLQRPAGYGLKTEYHLWASLFEGLVPILIAHTNPKVRWHASLCLWTLVRRFGAWFDTNVQLSLLGPLMRSAFSAVANDEELLADRQRYEPFLLSNLCGVVSACALEPHLLRLAFAALEHVAGLLRHRKCVDGGLGDVLLVFAETAIAALFCVEAEGGCRRHTAEVSCDTSALSTAMAIGSSSPVYLCTLDGVATTVSLFYSSFVSARAEEFLRELLCTHIHKGLQQCWSNSCVLEEHGLAALLPCAFTTRTAVKMVASVCRECIVQLGQLQHQSQCQRETKELIVAHEQEALLCVTQRCAAWCESFLTMIHNWELPDATEDAAAATDRAASAERTDIPEERKSAATAAHLPRVQDGFGWVWMWLGFRHLFPSSSSAGNSGDQRGPVLQSPHTEPALSRLTQQPSSPAPASPLFLARGSSSAHLEYLRRPSTTRGALPPSIERVLHEQAARLTEAIARFDAARLVCDDQPFRETSLLLIHDVIQSIGNDDTSRYSTLRGCIFHTLASAAMWYALGCVGGTGSSGQQQRANLASSATDACGATGTPSGYRLLDYFSTHSLVKVLPHLSTKNDLAHRGGVLMKSIETQLLYLESGSSLPATAALGTDVATIVLQRIA